MTKEEALRRVKGYLTDYIPADNYEEVEEIVEALEQEPKWIPVSERLPGEHEWVLVTVEQNGHRYTDIMRRDKYIDAWTDSRDTYTDEITAWMPLPEPYKAESEDKHD